MQLQSKIVNDRKGLFRGVLAYKPLDPMPVEETRAFQATLIAVGNKPTSVRIPRGNVVGSRSLQVGGVQEAKLSARGGGVDIALAGPPRRLIARPGDRAVWAWNITPKEPKDYTLELVVITYQGTGDNPLDIINPPIEIELTVTNTWWHRIKSMNTAAIGAAAFVGAVAILWKPVGALLSWWTNRRRGQQKQGGRRRPSKAKR